MWGFLMSLLVGLIAGTLAKALVPGNRKEPSSWIVTMILGMVGAVIAHLLFGALGWSYGGVIGSITASTVGAVILIALMRAFSK